LTTVHQARVSMREPALILSEAMCVSVPFRSGETTVRTCHVILSFARMRLSVSTI